MSREKWRIILKAGLEQNRQITPVDDVPRRAERLQVFNEIPEVGNHLRRAARQIDRRDIGLGQPIDHPVDRFTGHDFLALRPGIHVAVNAGEIAEFADVDLQNLRPGVTKWERMFGQFARKTVVGR